MECFGGSVLYKVVDIEIRIEFVCKIIDVNKFWEILVLIFYLLLYDGINKIIEILVSDFYVYVFFEWFFGDLYLYVRIKCRLKEEEVSKLFY